MPRRDYDPNNTLCHRACDRCRRKKIKCDSENFSCTGCRDVDQACSFDDPLGRRGPKGKPRRLMNNVNTSPLPLVDSPGASLSSPPLSFTFPVARVGLPYVDLPSTPGFFARQSSSTPLEQWTCLSNAVAQASSPSTSLEAIVKQCADVFFDYLQPSTISVHEPTYRACLDRALETRPSGLDLTALEFTLITAVCAKACFFVPSDLFPLGNCLGEVFLRASRACLKSFDEIDAENPCADSVTVRYLHSNCLHAYARPKVSWLVFGEAIRLVQGMRLYEERSYKALDPVEALKRRTIFWHLYVGDKSLSVLRGMPVTLSSHSFEEGISTQYPGDEGNELIVGFNAGIPLWQFSADLLFKIRLVNSVARSFPDSSPISLTPIDHAELGNLYVRFATCLDGLPPHLQFDNSMPPGDIPGARNKFAPQITDLQITYLSLKLHLVQKLEEVGYFSLTGEHKDMVLLRKTEVAQEMVQFLQATPFWSLKVNGEPCVEKIRLVGASLLAICQEELSPLAVRARRDFGILLNILARLDSRASDSLRRELE